MSSWSAREASPRPRCYVKVASGVLVGAALVALLGCSNEPGIQPSPVAVTRPPGMVVDCGDVPEPACTEAAAGFGSFANGERVIQMVMRCNVSPCTASGGQAELGMRFASGERMSSGHAWGATSGSGSTIPQDVSSVAPLCQGVPAAFCAEMATSGGLPLGAPDVATVTVRCLSPECSAGEGTGRTTILFSDGTRMRFEWGYGD
jgi:hypothetical protein